MLPTIQGEFGVVFDPDLRFSDKGSAWIKIRGVAKDRIRDANGTWGDGDPCFIDITTNVGAEHLFDSVAKGDTIMVIGKLKQREYEKDGQKHTVYEIRADSVGVSTRWNTAKTPSVTQRETSMEAVATDILGASESSDQAPF